MRLYREQLPIVIPHTFNSLQKLVMAMADVVKNADKRTWFGSDKGQLAYAHFLKMLRATLQSMVLDQLVRESTTSHDVANVLEEKLIEFAMAYPNWQDAYGFAAIFLCDQRTDAVATIERLRSAP